MSEYQEPVELTDVECRIVGAMIEKSFTTPDVYPMTTNALTSACNQKSNRDPVVDYTSVTIDSALLDLRQRNIVRRVHTPGSRSTKHRQTLDERLELNSRSLALMSVLLLRGPQTLGELRQRTERALDTEAFAELSEVEAALEAMASRSRPLVRLLARQPGQKESRWQHLIGTDEYERVGAAPAADDVPRAPEPAPERRAEPAPEPTVTERPAHATPPIRSSSAPDPGSPRATASQPPESTEDLQRRVADLESDVATLRRQLRTLAEQLGESLD